MNSVLRPNSLAFIALSNEFCHAVESARQTTPAEFVNGMLRLLPRIYISASDIKVSDTDDGEVYMADALTEDYYKEVRTAIETLLGGEDTFLEVQEEDMKYSDIPIGASIAEHLSDIFQILYNFLETVRDASEELTESALTAVKEDFDTYWSQKLCNVMKPLNHLHYSGLLDNID